MIENFLDNLGDDIHDMLSDNNDFEAHNYDGLDSNRDTEAEVETAVRFFPEVSPREVEAVEEEEEEEVARNYYPLSYFVFDEDHTLS